MFLRDEPNLYICTSTNDKVTYFHFFFSPEVEINMGKLDGNFVLITGGSKEIGFATGQEFVDEGAYVFITGRRQEVVDAAVKELGEKSVTGIQADSSKLIDIDKIVQIIEKEKGKLDILFASSGLSPIESITEEFLDNLFNILMSKVFSLLFKRRYQYSMMVAQFFFVDLRHRLKLFHH